MRNRRHVDKELFDKLLGWLHTDRELAAQKYEDIRRRLITIFTYRGCAEAEDLADETFDRVTRKVCEVAETYVGDPALYFYGVGHNVHLEYMRKQFSRPAPPPPPPPLQGGEEEESEPEYGCLEECMQRLARGDRELVLQYYKEDKRAKIEHRKKLAAQLGIAINALRIRAFKIRQILQTCVQECVTGSST
jgi:DNA-directed RNA polymerase specialized sigma24 family protein